MHGNGIRQADTGKFATGHYIINALGPTNLAGFQ